MLKKDSNFDESIKSNKLNKNLISNSIVEFEVLLFAIGDWISDTEIKKLINIKPELYFDELNNFLKGHGLMVIKREINIDNKKVVQYKMEIKPEYETISKKLINQLDIPKPILETLSLIIILQPVLQSDIIKTRGSSAYQHIKYLLNNGFITKQKISNTYKLKITPKFFEYFDVTENELKNLMNELNTDINLLKSKLEALENKEEKKKENLKNNKTKDNNQNNKEKIN